MVAEKGIRSAVAFSGPMAQYLDVPGLSRRVVDFCDVDSAKWTQYAADRRWPMSRLYRREGERLLDFERAPRRRRGEPFVTEAEAEVFQRAAPEVNDRVGVMPQEQGRFISSPRQRGASPYPAGAPVIALQRCDGLLAERRRGVLVRWRAPAGDAAACLACASGSWA